MGAESEEPNGSRLTNLKVRSKSKGDNTNGISTGSTAVVDEEPLKPRKTFGRTPDGRSNYPLPSPSSRRVKVRLG